MTWNGNSREWRIRRSEKRSLFASQDIHTLCQLIEMTQFLLGNFDLMPSRAARIAAETPQVFYMARISSALFKSCHHIIPFACFRLGILHIHVKDLSLTPLEIGVKIHTLQIFNLFAKGMDGLKSHLQTFHSQIKSRAATLFKVDIDPIGLENSVFGLLEQPNVSDSKGKRLRNVFCCHFSFIY